MTKKYLFPLFPLWACTFILPFLLVSCNSEDAPFEEIECTTFERLLYSKDISLAETVDYVIADSGVTDDLLAPFEKEMALVHSLNIKYTVHAITYKTIDPNGNPVTASGVIYYPKNLSVKGVLEVSPINKSKGSCGTEECAMAEILPGLIGYICIVPDLVGCGSTAELPISYLQHENTARVSVDMRLAADEFIYNHYHHRLPKESILFGYSLGGSMAMSLAREYQLHPEYGVTVTDIFAGGGAYEPLEVIKAQLETNRSDYAIIPNILWSMDYYDKLELDFDNIFIGPLKENYNDWCRGYIPIAEMTQRLGTAISGYFSESFLNEYDTAEKYRPLMQALTDKTLPLDWVPKAKVHLGHAAEDHYVPTVCSDRLYEYLKNSGADVEYKKYDAQHVLAGLQMGVDFAYFLMDRHNLSK